MKKYDVLVVGGGASGLMAALCAAKAHCAVAVLDGNKKLGRKLLATGNGRCNVSNTGLSLSHYYGDAQSVASLLETEEDRALFAELGLLCKEDGEGRLYPLNLQAAAVLGTLSGACAELGVDCFCEAAAFRVVKTNEGFFVKCEDGRSFFGNRLVLATGGKAAPKLSAQKDGYALAQQLGHSITPLHPALTQLCTKEPFVHPLAGMRCRAELQLFSGDTCLGQEQGEVLFGDKAISGICIFALSTPAAAHFAAGGGPLWLHMDLCPTLSKADLLGFLGALCQRRPQLLGGDLLLGLVNQKVGQALVRRAKIDPLRPAGSLSPAQLDAVVAELKSLRLCITGTKGWEEAQVTAGGVPLQELSVLRLESKKQKGLFLAGELLNIHGDCGGYNLHWAWVSGMRAGKSAADDRIFL